MSLCCFARTVSAVSLQTYSLVLIMACGVALRPTSGQESLGSAPVNDVPGISEPPSDPDAPTKPDALTRPETLPEAKADVPNVSNAKLRFNFSGADWRMALDWLADEAGLSLQVDRVPGGTVNFSDPTRTYSLSESMDVINRLLLDKGFALVRRGRLLMLIDLESDNASGLINEFAELVTPDELSTRADSDIVRCVFPLGSLSPESARSEITQLIGPSGKAIVLESAKQVVVTETVVKLKAIRALLENAALAGSNVVEIVLKYRAADEILEIARPLLGLEEGMNTSEGIRIATGLYGDRLYATGEPSKCALLERIVERADSPLQSSASQSGGEQSIPKLETYAISNVEPATVIDVLHTLLAGMPDTRIASDPQSKGVIAFARPETHALIRATIDKLEGKGATFEVIQLHRLEPSQALLTINKFFGTTAASPGEGPTVDGDPVTGRLWVRGTAEQILLVRNLIEKLEGSDAIGPLGDRVRLLPYTGRTAEQTLEQLQTLWQVTGRKNKIRMVTPAAGKSTQSSDGITFPQRRVAGDRYEQEKSLQSPSGAGRPRGTRPAELGPPERQQQPKTAPPNSDPFEDARNSNPSNYRFVAQRAADSGPVDDRTADSDAVDSENGAKGGKAVEVGGDIIVSMTPSGMIIASDDPQALADFEELMRTLSDATSLGGAQPTVFWLKYAKAQDAAALATSILGGGDASTASSGGGLAGSVLGEIGGGMIGGLLGIGGGAGAAGSAGPVLTTTGSVSIIPDARLNALIVQANPVDMRMVEMVLEVIDREESPEDVQTTSKPQVIPVIYQEAEDVAKIVKGVYAERTADPNSNQRQPSPQDFINALRGGGGGRGGGGEDKGSKPAPVVIAVDARSNSLIVSAPPQDVEDIRELVEAIDAGGIESEETVQIVSLNGNMKPETVQRALESVLGTKVNMTAPSTPSQTPSAVPPASANSTPGSSAADIERRIEFFRSLRGGGTPGGAGGGNPFGGGGNPFGGGGGNPFGGGGPPGGGRSGAAGAGGGAGGGGGRGGR